MKDPYLSKGYQKRKLKSISDCLVLGLDIAACRVLETIVDLSEEEFHWEPLTSKARQKDIPLPSAKKRVWRVFEKRGKLIYDYTPKDLKSPPFTTIAWILNHISQTADMYLWCVKTNKAEGTERAWDELPVYSSVPEGKKYFKEVFQKVKKYLSSIDKKKEIAVLNAYTPAPWGEKRPTYLNLWGGIIEHTLQHAMQMAVRKEVIRSGYTKLID